MFISETLKEKMKSAGFKDCFLNGNTLKGLLGIYTEIMDNNDKIKVLLEKVTPDESNKDEIEKATCILNTSEGKLKLWLECFFRECQTHPFKQAYLPQTPFPEILDQLHAELIIVSRRCLICMEKQMAEKKLPKYETIESSKTESCGSTLSCNSNQFSTESCGSTLSCSEKECCGNPENCTKDCNEKLKCSNNFCFSPLKESLNAADLALD